MKVYILMSTSDHESEYTVHDVYANQYDAEQAELKLWEELTADYEEDLADDPEFDTGWHVWLEEKEVILGSTTLASLISQEIGNTMLRRNEDE